MMCESCPTGLERTRASVTLPSRIHGPRGVITIGVGLTAGVRVFIVQKVTAPRAYAGVVGTDALEGHALANVSRALSSRSRHKLVRMIVPLNSFISSITRSGVT